MMHDMPASTSPAVEHDTSLQVAPPLASDDAHPSLLNTNAADMAVEAPERAVKPVDTGQCPPTEAISTKQSERTKYKLLPGMVPIGLGPLGLGYGFVMQNTNGADNSSDNAEHGTMSHCGGDKSKDITHSSCSSSKSPGKSADNSSKQTNSSTTSTGSDDSGHANNSSNDASSGGIGSAAGAMSCDSSSSNGAAPTKTAKLSRSSGKSSSRSSVKTTASSKSSTGRSSESQRTAPYCLTAGEMLFSAMMAEMFRGVMEPCADNQRDKQDSSRSSSSEAECTCGYYSSGVCSAAPPPHGKHEQKQQQQQRDTTKDSTTVQFLPMESVMAGMHEMMFGSSSSKTGRSSSSSSSSKGLQEAATNQEWGKSEGLKGFKGLFKKPSTAATATPAGAATATTAAAAASRQPAAAAAVAREKPAAIDHKAPAETSTTADTAAAKQPVAMAAAAASGNTTVVPLKPPAGISTDGGTVRAAAAATGPAKSSGKPAAAAAGHAAAAAAAAAMSSTAQKAAKVNTTKTQQQQQQQQQQQDSALTGASAGSSSSSQDGGTNNDDNSSSSSAAIKDTPLHEALLKHPDKALAASLLSCHESDVDCLDSSMGWTALHYAAAAHNAQAVAQLLQAGASPTMYAQGSGLTPLHLAAISRADLSTKAKQNQFKKQCESLYKIQSRQFKDHRSGCAAIVRMLLDFGADAAAAATATAAATPGGNDYAQMEGATVLHFAAACTVDVAAAAATKEDEDDPVALFAAAAALVRDAAPASATVHAKMKAIAEKCGVTLDDAPNSQVGAEPPAAAAADNLNLHTGRQQSATTAAAAADQAQAEAAGSAPAAPAPAAQDAQNGSSSSSSDVDDDHVAAAVWTASCCNNPEPCGEDDATTKNSSKTKAGKQDKSSSSGTSNTTGSSNSSNPAACKEQASIICSLLWHGADPNAALAANGETPLTIAAYNGANTAITALLLDDTYQCDPEITRDDGCRPVDLAIWAAHGSTALLLLSLGASAVPLRTTANASNSSKDKPYLVSELELGRDNRQPLQLLSNALRILGPKCPLKLVKLAVDAGFPVDVVNEFGGATALLYAIQFSLPKVVRLLIAAGADVNLPWTKGTTSGMSPLIYAALHGNIDIMEQLVAAGASLKSTDPRPNMCSYNIVQTCVNNQHLDAALRMVELGCQWRVPRGTPQNHTVPAMAALRIAGAQASNIEFRLKLAEKKGKQMRAVASEPGTIPAPDLSRSDSATAATAVAANGKVPASEQQQRTAHDASAAAAATTTDDIDTLLAEIDGPAAAAVTPVLSKKALKAQKERERRQQQQQEQERKAARLAAKKQTKAEPKQHPQQQQQEMTTKQEAQQQQHDTVSKPTEQQQQQDEHVTMPKSEVIATDETDVAVLECVEQRHQQQHNMLHRGTSDEQQQQQHTRGSKSKGGAGAAALKQQQQQQSGMPPAASWEQQQQQEEAQGGRVDGLSVVLTQDQLQLLQQQQQRHDLGNAGQDGSDLGSPVRQTCDRQKQQQQPAKKGNKGAAAAVEDQQANKQRGQKAAAAATVCATHIGDKLVRIKTPDPVQQQQQRGQDRHRQNQPHQQQQQAKGRGHGRKQQRPSETGSSVSSDSFTAAAVMSSMDDATSWPELHGESAAAAAVSAAAMESVPQSPAAAQGSNIWKDMLTKRQTLQYSAAAATDTEHPPAAAAAGTDHWSVPTAAVTAHDINTGSTSSSSSQGNVPDAWRQEGNSSTPGADGANATAATAACAQAVHAAAAVGFSCQGAAAAIPSQQLPAPGSVQQNIPPTFTTADATPAAVDIDPHTSAANVLLSESNITSNNTNTSADGYAEIAYGGFSVQPVSTAANYTLWQIKHEALSGPAATATQAAAMELPPAAAAGAPLVSPHVQVHAQCGAHMSQLGAEVTPPLARHTANSTPAAAAAAPMVAAAAAAATTSSPAGALQNWKGKLPPMFTYGRQQQQHQANAPSPAAAAATDNPAAAAAAAMHGMGSTSSSLPWLQQAVPLSVPVAEPGAVQVLNVLPHVLPVVHHQSYVPPVMPVAEPVNVLHKVPLTAAHSEGPFVLPGASSAVPSAVHQAVPSHSTGSTAVATAAHQAVQQHVVPYAIQAASAQACEPYLVPQAVQPYVQPVAVQSELLVNVPTNSAAVQLASSAPSAVPPYAPQAVSYAGAATAVLYVAPTAIPLAVPVAIPVESVPGHSMADSSSSTMWPMSAGEVVDVSQPHTVAANWWSEDETQQQQGTLQQQQQQQDGTEAARESAWSEVGSLNNDLTSQCDVAQQTGTQHAQHSMMKSSAWDTPLPEVQHAQHGVMSHHDHSSSAGTEQQQQQQVSAVELLQLAARAMMPPKSSKPVPRRQQQQQYHHHRHSSAAAAAGGRGPGPGSNAAGSGGSGGGGYRQQKRAPTQQRTSGGYHSEGW